MLCGTLSYPSKGFVEHLTGFGTLAHFGTGLGKLVFPGTGLGTPVHLGTGFVDHCLFPRRPIGASYRERDRRRAMTEAAEL